MDRKGNVEPAQADRAAPTQVPHVETESGSGTGGWLDPAAMRARVKHHMPASKPGRIALGSGLVLGGILGFLPILGFWMVPLGLFVLAQDVPAARRIQRKATVRWERWRRARAARDGGA